jgi:hypothetical protein
MPTLDDFRDEVVKRMTVKELQEEMKRRRYPSHGTKRCDTCGGKWTIYNGLSNNMIIEDCCYGCRKAVNECTCKE